jgi:F420-dependent oxidoreductase-like protein
MRIGIMSGATGGPDATLDGLVARCRALEERGFASIWMANIFGLDAIGALAVVGRETRRIELGTAVVPTYPRHPVAMAQQALTTQAAARGRFVLGIGLSHRIVIENMLGLSYAKPARHMREYLSVLGPLLRKQPASFQGEEYRVNAGLDVADAEAVPLLVAALGERMLAIAGALAAGTILWMTGPKTIESHIGPRLRQAASEAGRPAPRIVAGFPIVVTNDPVGVRERVGKSLSLYGTLPSYRAMLDREGAAGPGDVALVGDEKALDRELERLRRVGVTDFNAAVLPLEDGAEARTLDYLQSRLGHRSGA